MPERFEKPVLIPKTRNPRILRLKRSVRHVVNGIRSFNKQKVFCIGRNKTGTTSLTKALTEAGIPVGLQAPAERLFKDWCRRDYRRIIRYCRTARAFQDIPFNLPGMYAILDSHFPGSKFILTIRSSSDEWFESYIRFQKKVHGNGMLPTVEMLKASTYGYPGFAYDTKKFLYKTTDDNIYDREKIVRTYELYNENVLDYFSRKPSDLLVINVAEPGAYRQFCEFLEIDCKRSDFPWENRTLPSGDSNTKSDPAD